MRPLPVLLLLLLALALAPAARAQEFSIDLPSPEIPGIVPNPSDILVGPPLFVAIPGPTLGLLALPAAPPEDLGEFSFGIDYPIPPLFRDLVWYSVSRGSAGLPGSPVAMEVDGAAGDIFGLYIDVPMVIGPPFLAFGAPALGLTPLPPVESNIDGLDWGINYLRGTVYDGPVYFTVNAAVAARWVVTTADIFYRPAPGPAAPPPALFATAGALGLVAGDVIDGLAVRDRGTRGVLDGPDFVYISLAPGSPSAAVLGTATIIKAFPPPTAIMLTAADLGLLDTDDVDAITIWDPDDPNPVGVEATNGLTFQLLSPYPNPALGPMMIEYDLPRSAPTRVQVFDLSGRLQTTLYEGQQPAGRHRTVWSAQGSRVGSVEPGVYWIRLESGGASVVRRVIRLR